MGAQQQEVAAAMAAASNACRQWIAKLTGMQQLLYSSQSAQFLDIRKREAEAFKVHNPASGLNARTASVGHRHDRLTAAICRWQQNYRLVLATDRLYMLSLAYSIRHTLPSACCVIG